MRAALRLLSQAAPLNPYKSGQRAGKLTTGIHGLPVHSNPLPALLSVYKSTLEALKSQVPEGVVYRQSAEALTQYRMGVIQKHAGNDGNQGGEAAVEAVESEIGAGVIEEVLKVAEGERTLVDKMAEWKS